MLLHDPGAAAAAGATGGEGGANAAAAAAAVNEFGVDPNVDPDLYMVLRMSLEEARQQQQQQETAAAVAGTGQPATAAGIFLNLSRTARRIFSSTVPVRFDVL